MAALGRRPHSGVLPGRLAKGQPYQVGERTLTPLARTVALGPADGRWRLRWIEPIAVVEVLSGRARLLPIRRPLRRVLFVGLVAPVLAYLAVRATIRR